MGYPDTIIATPTYVDKGVQVPTDTYSLILQSGSPSYMTCTLPSRARGKTTLADGTTYSSSISVQRGGDIFQEVFSLPVPSGKYFFHLDDANTETSTLYFHITQVDPVDVSYSTRGSIVKASIVNNIQSDLQAVETILGSGVSGVKAMQYGRIPTSAGPWTVPITYTGTITNLIPICSSDTGTIVTIDVSSLTQVVFTPSGTTALNYLILVV